MALHGSDLAADLIQLAVIGRVDLPALGATYAHLNNAVAGTADYDLTAFALPGRRAGMTASYELWSQLRDDLRDALGGTSTDMQNSATIMLHVVGGYISADEEAARIVTTAWKNGPPPHKTARDERAPDGPVPDVVTGDE
ncbi:hypothetical protein [Cryptosporangium sp. NPDC051539]|uniref:hypothetical protein n=1 Tax=Cryptosporangium sp. NPDC051539 TaxID=3363962 RepID=UPI0037B54B8F